MKASLKWSWAPTLCTALMSKLRNSSIVLFVNWAQLCPALNSNISYWKFFKQQLCLDRFCHPLDTPLNSGFGNSWIRDPSIFHFHKPAIGFMFPGFIRYFNLQAAVSSQTNGDIFLHNDNYGNKILGYILCIEARLQDTVCVCVLFSVFGHKNTSGIIQLGGLEG